MSGYNFYTEWNDDLNNRKQFQGKMDILDNMAMRYRHDYGLLPQSQRDSLRVSMSQLLEEVVLWLDKEAYNQDSTQKALALKETSILLARQMGNRPTISGQGE
jgi:hypothetical protein